MRNQFDAWGRRLCRRRLSRGRIEQPEIAWAGAAADLVIAAHDDPWGRAQGRRGGREEIRLPGRPVVAIGAARAAGVTRRAGALAIEVVADMDDEVGLGVGDALGHLREWPESGIVAVLEFASRISIVAVALLRRRLRRLEAAAGVAESGDRLQGGPGKGEGRILQAGGGGASRNGSLADEDREGGVGQGANAHWLLRAVDGDVRTTARLREHGARHRTLRTEHDIGSFEFRGLRVGRARRPHRRQHERRSGELASPSVGSRRDNRGHAMFLHFKPDRGFRT